MNDATLFQYCQKIVLFRNNDTEILLARRKGEADYDDTYSCVGGKLEATDGGIVEGLKREKDEEIGTSAKLSILPTLSYNLYFVKKNGMHMIMPHYYAEFQEGEIRLNDEYHGYVWVKLDELAGFKPKIETIPKAVVEVLKLKGVAVAGDFVTI